ncbi:Outer membrane protein Imp, required for envelope biogenesis / Organic solvent tolerance protein precursor [hydrothermal vent metagenome]|uniref:Outer membrane protein Imp, required for envelope biogenesis / Organic solvent tolerance protein n=1 Tax=hydrothermal vent metagenome TaxID=652676 RepID=A0A1W1D1F6_9ZZZZ
MYRFFLFYFITLSLISYANDKVEIYTASIKTKGDIVIADGDVNLLYKDNTLRANKAIYNKKNGLLELFGNIKLSFKNNYRILGDYAKLDLSQKEKIFQPFYLLDKKTDMWMSAKNATAQQEKINVKNGIVSGCDQLHPLWKLEFGSSDYNTTSKWINVYNTTLYFYDIPILYTPYFGYSLGTTRKTGFLIPSFGISSDEGIFYLQPFYIAEANNWDLEFDPQIRTKRGKGIYSTLRFVDTPDSYGVLKMGYFKEDSSYYDYDNLSNKHHSGFNFHYTNGNFLKNWFHLPLNGQSGLYMDLSQMSDIDYLNLASKNSFKEDITTQILSRINLFYNTDRNYIAAYFDYYQDLTKDSNSETMHKLPMLHYHHYLDELFKNYLLYNLDVKTTNIQNDRRTQNKTAQQTDVSLPILIRKSLWNEYINVAYKANFYAQNTKFNLFAKDANEKDYTSGSYLHNYNEFSISSELARGFEKFNHIITFGATYRVDGFKMQNGYYDEVKDYCNNPDNAKDAKCSFYNIEQIDDAVNLEFTQYFYDKATREILYHRLVQNILLQKNGENVYGDLENELEYRFFQGWSFYNNMFYNYDKHDFSKIFNKITYKNDKIGMDLSHLYKNSFADTNSYSSYLTSGVSYRYNSHYSYKFLYDYDLRKKIKKGMEIGFLYEKRCLNFGLSYVENNRPKATKNMDESVYDKYIYINIILKPIMPPHSQSSALGVKLN